MRPFSDLLHGDRGGPRYSLLPCLRDYDRMGLLFVPYAMFINTPEFRSASVNTDIMGLRVNVTADGNALAAAHSSAQEVNLVVGGSTAFGIGATSDRLSLSSLLTAETGETWLNFGSRSYTLQQSLIHFVSLAPAMSLTRIKRCVLFTGVNDLSYYGVSPVFSPLFGVYAGISRYTKEFNGSEFAKAPKELMMDVGDRAAQKELLASQLVSALRGWAQVARGWIDELVFVLQPVMDWCDKSPTEEEERICQYLDSVLSPEARAMRGFLRREYGWFSDTIAAACGELGVTYYDFNRSWSEPHLAPRWLFSDSVHFTDDGHRLAAVQLAEIVGGCTSQLNQGNRC